ncbi:hypothetical protein [Sphingomonas echinoides]|uniref:hypothetical protein n=1 Tax=Sphingomonas echinoides TaxID=59803 RepID=UPI0024132CEE|nr:hypothetical protein [Sphingomonas echinoides]
MTRKMLTPLRPFLLATACIASVTGGSSGAFAQSVDPAPVAPATPTPSTDTIRLSDAERDAILNSNTVESAAIARGEREETGKPGLGIHGEVGAAIGTNGYRSAYGVAAIPLGDNAGAVVSFESTQFGGYRQRR